MSTASFVRLIALAAIWGGSFLFMRMGAPVLGPVLLIELRVGLAAIFLLVMSLALHKRMYLKDLWRHYLVIGGQSLNSSATPNSDRVLRCETITNNCKPKSAP